MNARTYDPSKLTGALLHAFNEFGALTPAELDLYERNLQQRIQAPQQSNAVDVSHIVNAFEHALAAGRVRQPMVHVNGFIFKYATRGATPGAVFIVETESGWEEYLGKIYKGEFLPTRACTGEQRTRILQVAANPLEAIIAFGKQTGKCSICNRKLTDPESIEAAVGPICRRKFGL